MCGMGEHPFHHFIWIRTIQYKRNNKKPRKVADYTQTNINEQVMTETTSHLWALQELMTLQELLRHSLEQVQPKLCHG